jgi:HAD superfamily hydrolase (TIGR01509 family)
MSKNQVKAVIFDMDGTLVDSREIVLGAFKHVLDEFGGEYSDERVSRYVGGRLENTYQDLLPNHEFGKLADLHRSWQVDNKHLLKSFKGLDEFLNQLKMSGQKLGLFTSATRTRTDLALDGLNIREYFDAVVCAEDVKNPKPDEEGVLKLVRDMKVKLSEVVLVGDAEYDILSGKNAGVTTIGVTHGFGTKEALEKAGADYIVSNLDGISQTIEKLMIDK